MKLVFICLMFILNFASISLANDLPSPTSSNSGAMVYNTAMIKACGVAVGNDKAAFAAALTDAKRKAAEKAVARFVAPSADADSIYQKVIAAHDLYITDKAEILKQEKRGGKLLLFCNVPVNFEGIQLAIQREVTPLQKANRVDKAMFLVRVVNLPQEDAAAVSDIRRNVLVQYEEAFKIYNFKALGAEAAGSNIMLLLDTTGAAAQEQLGFEEYRQKVLEELAQVAEVSIAVIGEINVAKTEIYNDSAYAEAICNIEMVHMAQQGYEKIGSFSDAYSVLRPNLKEALEIVTQAAAVKSAKYLVNLTFSYWQEHKEIRR